MIDLTKSPPPLTVWIDGSCPVCRRSQRWCAVRDGDRRLSFRDLHEAREHELPAPVDSMMASLHLEGPSGPVLTGFDAWRTILGQLPGWRWPARLAGLPGFRQLGSLLYRVVAANRHWLASF